MLSEKTVQYIERILLTTKKRYPHTSYILSLGEIQNHSREPEFDEAVDILIQEGFIEDRGGSHMITPGGLELVRTGGYEQFLQRKIKSQKQDEYIKKLQFEKLVEDVKKVKADNRIVRVLAIIGSVGTMLQIVKFFIEYFNKK